MPSTFRNVCFYLQIIILMVFLASCTTSNVIGIDGSDSVSFTTLQASFPVTENEEFPRIKVRLTNAEEGNFTQSIPSGLIIDFEGYTFSGPGNIAGSFNLSMNAFAFGAEQAINENTHLGWYIGLAQVDMDLLISSFSQSAMTNSSTKEPFFEVLVHKNISPKLIGRASLSGVVSLGSSSTSLIELDAGIGYKLLRNMEFMAGFRIWNYQYTTDEYESEILLHLTGPYLGINISF